MGQSPSMKIIQQKNYEITEWKNESWRKAQFALLVDGANMISKSGEYLTRPISIDLPFLETEQTF